MRSVVELELGASHKQVADLFNDPKTFPEWMDELERCERISGRAGTPGSEFRLVPKSGNLQFIAKLMASDPPYRARLILDADNVSVAVTGIFTPLSERRTRLVSEEIFSFKGVLPSVCGLLARRSIRRVHRRHMESFKRFAESRA
jgi:hypothetical protein